jgi:hypothetical protein
MGFILKEKLKGLKAKLKVWNKEVYGAFDTKILFLVEEVKEKDLRGEEGASRFHRWSFAKNILRTFGIFLIAKSLWLSIDRDLGG